MNFIAAGLTDVGLQREHNEDSYCILAEHRLFLVADGMGGHRAGDIASQMATQTISAFFTVAEQFSSPDDMWPFSFEESMNVDANRLLTSIKLANQQIFDTSLRHREVQGMGTTVVGALLIKADKRIYIAHVGDSRAYRLRDGFIEQLTRDHSLVNDYLLVMPHLTDAQKRELPSNVITRALGMQEAVAVDIQTEDVKVGDSYLLCSDGLNGMLDDDDILSAIEAADDIEEAATALVAKANARGGEDNITVVIVKILD